MPVSTDCVSVFGPRQTIRDVDAEAPLQQVDARPSVSHKAPGRNTTRNKHGVKQSLTGKRCLWNGGRGGRWRSLQHRNYTHTHTRTHTELDQAQERVCVCVCVCVCLWCVYSHSVGVLELADLLDLIHEVSSVDILHHKI